MTKEFSIRYGRSLLLGKNKEVNRKLLYLLCLLLPLLSAAQNPSARYEIDAKRIGVLPTDKEALPRSREFIRLDSTYYVGWMYQGIYLHERSVDQSGYQRTLPLLRKAFLLLEKDYSGILKSLYSDPMVYMQNTTRYSDYLILASKLREEYEYLEQPDSAMWVLKQVEKKNFRRDFFGIAGLKAWIIHRNRFYTHSKYEFLGNSVAENEQQALQSCYDGFARIKRNQAANNKWFGEGHVLMDQSNIYHYLALIHCYLKNYDSSEYYYQQMQTIGTVSNNNYGSMKAEVGDFAQAISLYSKDKYKYGDVKSLMEPFYYLPILYIYSGKTKEAMNTAKEAIRYSNSSPGFGWYNIALARSYMYDGQLDSALITLDKAAAFKEIHIGTTLTQPQYDFSIALLKLVWYNKKIDQLKFFHKNWWYNPTALYQLAQLQLGKHTQEYLLATQLALNPERARIIYDLFCGESTVSYDEVWYLMKRYSPRYFMKLMENYIASDPRPNIKRYYELYKARLQWEAGEKDEAGANLKNLLINVQLDTAHEKLFLGRLYEGLCNMYKREDNTMKLQRFQNTLVEQYPQLVPFADEPVHLHLQTAGTDDAVTQQVVKELKNCNIVWENNTAGFPVATVSFKKKGAKYEAEISTIGADKRRIVWNERFLFMQPEGAGQEIAMRIFGASGAPELERPGNQKK